METTMHMKNAKTMEGAEMTELWSTTKETTKTVKPPRRKLCVINQAL
jgi:hypothetical protein